MKTNSIQIANDYKEFVNLARELAKEDVTKYPLDKKRESEQDRYEVHLIGMIQLYNIRFGDPDQRLQIVNFLERQLFRTLPIEKETSHLTYDMWEELKKVIISGEYQESKSIGGKE